MMHAAWIECKRGPFYVRACDLQGPGQSWGYKECDAAGNGRCFFLFILLSSSQVFCCVVCVVCSAWFAVAGLCVTIFKYDVLARCRALRWCASSGFVIPPSSCSLPTDGGDVRCGGDVLRVCACFFVMFLFLLYIFRAGFFFCRLGCW